MDDSVTFGIYAVGSVRIAGNTVSNTHGPFNQGIALLRRYAFGAGSEVIRNVAHDNDNGIFSDLPIRENRVYHNTSTGILFGNVDHRQRRVFKPDRHTESVFL